MNKDINARVMDFDAFKMFEELEQPKPKDILEIKDTIDRLMYDDVVGLFTSTGRAKKSKNVSDIQIQDSDEDVIQSTETGEAGGTDEFAVTLQGNSDLAMLRRANGMSTDEDFAGKAIDKFVLMEPLAPMTDKEYEKRIESSKIDEIKDKAVSWMKRSYPEMYNTYLKMEEAVSANPNDTAKQVLLNDRILLANLLSKMLDKISTLRSRDIAHAHRSSSSTMVKNEIDKYTKLPSHEGSKSAIRDIYTIFMTENYPDLLADYEKYARISSAMNSIKDDKKAVANIDITELANTYAELYDVPQEKAIEKVTPKPGKTASGVITQMYNEANDQRDGVLEIVDKIISTSTPGGKINDKEVQSMVFKKHNQKIYEKSIEAAREKAANMDDKELIDLFVKYSGMHPIDAKIKVDEDTNARESAAVLLQRIATYKPVQIGQLEYRPKNDAFFNKNSKIVIHIPVEETKTNNSGKNINVIRWKQYQYDKDNLIVNYDPETGIITLPPTDKLVIPENSAIGKVVNGTVLTPKYLAKRNDNRTPLDKPFLKSRTYGSDTPIIYDPEDGLPVSIKVTVTYQDWETFEIDPEDVVTNAPPVSKFFTDGTLNTNIRTKKSVYAEIDGMTDDELAVKYSEVTGSNKQEQIALLDPANHAGNSSQQKFAVSDERKKMKETIVLALSGTPDKFFVELTPIAKSGAGDKNQMNQWIQFKVGVKSMADYRQDVTEDISDKEYNAEKKREKFTGEYRAMEVKVRRMSEEEMIDKYVEITGEDIDGVRDAHRLNPAEFAEQLAWVMYDEDMKNKYMKYLGGDEEAARTALRKHRHNTVSAIYAKVRPTPDDGKSKPMPRQIGVDEFSKRKIIEVPAGMNQKSYAKLNMEPSSSFVTGKEIRDMLYATSEPSEFTSTGSYVVPNSKVIEMYVKMIGVSEEKAKNKLYRGVLEMNDEQLAEKYAEAAEVSPDMAANAVRSSKQDVIDRIVAPARRKMVEWIADEYDSASTERNKGKDVRKMYSELKSDNVLMDLLVTSIGLEKQAARYMISSEKEQAVKDLAEAGAEPYVLSDEQMATDYAAMAGIEKSAALDAITKSRNAVLNKMIQLGKPSTQATTERTKKSYADRQEYERGKKVNPAVASYLESKLKPMSDEELRKEFAYKFDQENPMPKDRDDLIAELLKMHKEFLYAKFTDEKEMRKIQNADMYKRNMYIKMQSANNLSDDALIKLALEEQVDLDKSVQVQDQFNDDMTKYAETASVEDMLDKYSNELTPKFAQDVLKSFRSVKTCPQANELLLNAKMSRIDQEDIRSGYEAELKGAKKQYIIEKVKDASDNVTVATIQTLEKMVSDSAYGDDFVVQKAIELLTKDTIAKIEEDLRIEHDGKTTVQLMSIFADPKFGLPLDDQIISDAEDMLNKYAEDQAKSLIIQRLREYQKMRLAGDITREELLQKLHDKYSKRYKMMYK